MLDDEYWVRAAVSGGFTRAGRIDAGLLTFENAETFRAYCAQNTCGTYNACWTCPPGVGPVKFCVAKVRSYKRALFVQYEEAGLQNNAGISRVRAHFKSLMEEFAPMVRESYPDALALGSGGCRICPECAYPNNPCRHPDRMIQSVSAFCIDAGQACGLAGLPCWRDGYISFTGIFLTG